MRCPEFYNLVKAYFVLDVAFFLHLLNNNLCYKSADEYQSRNYPACGNLSPDRLIGVVCSALENKQRNHIPDKESCKKNRCNYLD